MNKAQMQGKQQLWGEELKQCLAEISVLESQAKEKRERAQFLRGAIAAAAEMIQEDDIPKKPTLAADADWQIDNWKQFAEGWERSWGEVVHCMNRAMRRAAKRLAKANGASDVPTDN